MSDLSTLLQALAPQAQAINHRPNGVGHLLHIAPDPDSGTIGFLLCCAGTTDADGNVTRHLIGTITKGPDSDDYMAIENPRDAVWTLDPAQTSFDPANPVCYCGQPAKI